MYKFSQSLLNLLSQLLKHVINDQIGCLSNMEVAFCVEEFNDWIFLNCFDFLSCGPSTSGLCLDCKLVICTLAIISYDDIRSKPELLPVSESRELMRFAHIEGALFDIILKQVVDSCEDAVAGKAHTDLFRLFREL